MKDALKRAAAALGFTSAPTVALEAVTPPTDALTTVDTLAVDVVVTGGDELAATLADFETKLAEQGAAFAEQGTALATVLSQLAESQAALAEVTAALTAVHEAKELAEANALAAKLTARKEKILAALGTERADAFMAATEAMPDAQFDTVMAAMAVTSAGEASSPAFTETGVEASANVDALVAEAETSGTGAMLAAKYQKQASK